MTNEFPKVRPSFDDQRFTAHDRTTPLSRTLSPMLNPTSSSSSNGHGLLSAPSASKLSIPLSDSFASPETPSMPADIAAEVAAAGLSIAADGTFVETTSPHAARELKRRYDSSLGVGKGKIVRSPYSITAVQGPNGQVYRIGPRPQPQPSARRPRLSVGGFLPPSIFKNGSAAKENASPAPPASSRSPRRTLRKTRSIPDIQKPTVTIEPPSEIYTVMGISGLAQLPSPSAGSRHSLDFDRDDDQPLNFPLTTPDTFPFGEGVNYTPPPLRRDDFYLTPAPQHHALRVMQSFESGLTARAEPEPSTARASAELISLPSTAHELLSPPPPPPAPPSHPPSILSDETNSMSRFTTQVFEVLQTFRGAPLPDTLSSTSTEPTIRLSSTLTAAPKDDPRFVIWGEILGDLDEAAQSQSSRTDVSSLSHTGRRKGTKGTDSADGSAPGGLQKVLMAATIERWIAQLTSELNYEELLNFFLTYRTYISSVDLCHLLICRFHWALETASSSHDETVRRIVRVRTFIALRYWLLTFFRIDFLPNPDLCHTFTTWINTLRKDPALLSKPDAMNIVRKLKKVVRECKEAHIRSSAPASSAKNSSVSSRSTAQSGDLTLGDFGLKKLSMDDDDSDVDLDFGNGNGQRESLSGFHNFLPQLNPTERRDAPAALAPAASVEPASIAAVGSTSTARAEALSPSQVILQQPLHKTILAHSKSSAVPVANIPAPLPMQHSVLSRAFVNTIGRLGRWRRELNSRSSINPSTLHCADNSAFDLELNATGDLLTVRGGVEQYLKMLNLPPMIEAPVPSVPPPPPPPPKDNIPEPNSHDDHVKVVESVSPKIVAPPELPLLGSISPHQLPPLAEAGESEADIYSLKAPSQLSLTPSSIELATDLANTNYTSKLGNDPIAAPPTTTVIPRSSEDSEASRPSLDGGSSISESLTDASSNHIAGSDSLANGNWLHQHPGVVALDDYLSDSESEEHGHAKRPPRRLPNRRDFEFVRRSDSVSSLGMRSFDAHSSVASSSAMSTSSVASSSHGPGAAFGHGAIKTWQIEMIESDEDEPGDVDAALRRLEGQIDRTRQKAKEIKVDGWLKQVAERLAAGDIHDAPDNEHDGDSFDSSEPRDSEDQPSVEVEDLTVSVPRTSISSVSRDEDSLAPPIELADPSPSTPTANDQLPDAAAAIPLPDTETPLSPLSPTMPQASFSPNSQIQPLKSKTSFIKAMGSRQPPAAKFSSPNVPSQHHSFVLLYRSEDLARHFCLIERELFLAIKFEDFVMQENKDAPEQEVLDWAQYLKDQYKLKQAARSAGEHTATDLLLVRARFTMVVNFTASEIVLTHHSQRVAVVSKFIRIAWKCYLANNFPTLVAIIAGLQTPAVNAAMRRIWNRVGIYEMRIFEDLKAYTSPEGNYKYIRQSITALSDSRPIGAAQDSGSLSSENPRSDIKAACVPWIGIYLRQMVKHAQLPDYVDPTSPTEPVNVHPDGTLAPVQHPEVFSTLAPLPPGLSIEPLINVHKQRLVAGVVKSLVAGQHLASNINYQMEKKLYIKCLRLRCLSANSQMSLATMTPEA